MSKVELHAAIRRDARAGLSGRTIEAKYHVTRRTVGKALASAWPEPRKPLPVRPSKLDAFKPVVDEILRTDLDAPRKQRHTAKPVDRVDALLRRRGITGGPAGWSTCSASPV
jgi:transposase